MGCIHEIGCIPHNGPGRRPNVCSGNLVFARESCLARHQNMGGPRCLSSLAVKWPVTTREEVGKNGRKLFE